MKTEEPLEMTDTRIRSRYDRESGIGLIIVILVLAFLASVGIALLTTTDIGNRVSGNIRWQEEAFNAAETGFDAAWALLENSFTAGGWTSFDGQYLNQPAGIDDPDITKPQSQQYYFRRLTDRELLATFASNGIDQTTTGMLFYHEPYILDAGGSMDTRYTYTVFLIDDEVGLNITDATDVLLVCIGTAGTGNNMVTARVEAVIGIE
jgi:hypothetical protein